MSKSTSKYMKVAGSEKKPLVGARVSGKINPEERIEITLLVRSRAAIAQTPAFREMLAAAPAERKPMTREQWRDTYGADPADLALIEEFAHQHEIDVVRSSIAERRVVLSGTIAQLTKAFPVKLQKAVFKGKTLRVRTGAVGVPAELAKIVEDVKGFDNRPQAQPHFRRSAKGVRPRTGAARPFTPTEVGQLYNFPTKLNGTGECIAIIELGGGYRTADINKYFADIGLAAPKVSAISVDGGHNTPGQDADGEVMLDIEVAGAIAPKAKIAVYFAPNTDQGFLDAITRAIHDSLRKPSVISISWGGPEDSWTAQSMRNYDAVFREAAMLGVTITVAAGDHGSSDVDPNDKKQRVDFPSASPFVLSCGGTHLEASGTSISSEVVWNTNDGWATGGGVSANFPLPAYQKQAGVPTLKGKAGRGVPDVAGDADNNTGYKTRVDGQDTVIGGTSAVAPLWAGLIALFNQSLGKPVGFLNPQLYTNAAIRAAFHDISVGNNGKYAAGPGWDACTGLGSPDGSALLKLL
jgi:kumamolisin